jgi:4a-hydroxytetrahydrobiopterin dehydratase
MTAYNENEINENLQKISGWKFNNQKIEKEYLLKDFSDALGFVNKVGQIAEAMDHHPDILMHSWNKVKISVSTHSENGITKKDFELASKIESI